ncbi:MAG TPA: PIG-L family deacetylase [Candidatus Limnocylindria bacterium]|nr:PIG-L family deacetylase [Candidatus Limnocylindria bacterium]
MTHFATLAQVQKLGTILGVWAHPDDESVLTGGLMAAAIQNGQTVACITATKGEAGTQDPVKWPLATLGKVRAQELENALRILGVAHHHWLDYTDGGCASISDQAAVRHILPIIEQYQPDTILTFAPDGFSGHDDHRAVSRWARLAAEQASKRPAIYRCVTLNTEEGYQKYFKVWDEKLNVYFNVDTPKLYKQAECDLVFQLPADILDKKYQAVEAMPSQMEQLFQVLGADFVRQMLAEECLVRG